MQTISARISAQKKQENVELITSLSQKHAEDLFAETESKKEANNVMMGIISIMIPVIRPAR